MRQSHKLYTERMTLGARILLRSGFETTATLVYLNAQMRGVVDDTIDFHEFSETTSRLLLGSKNKSTRHQAINILTTLKSVEKSYPGVETVFAALSESAHPNWEGMGFGFARIDHEQDVANFSNNLSEMFEKTHIGGMELCMSMYEHEYNEIWPHLFEALEQFLVKNNEKLEASQRNGV